jgi:KRAB domain-containing zinc finger protein
MKITNRKVRFQCTKCSKHYSTKHALKAHTNVSHDKVKRYQCYFCSLAIFSESRMIEHMSIHTKEKSYKCQYCFQSFTKKQSLKKHHKGGKSCIRKLTYPLLRPCYFCDQVFSNNRLLNEHMIIVHLKEDFKLCNLCCKYFSSTSAINQHIRIVHLLERNYKCQLCSKTLCTNEDLLRHIQSGHTKEKPFKCYFCSKSFVISEVLKRHMLIHTGEKPLTCYFCRKEFSAEQSLSVHIGRIHTKERPFKCMGCPSRCYTSKATLNAHVRKKHGMFPRQ